jgi:hypothetical protein
MMHITHGKAGSTWIDRLLRELFGKRVSPRMYQLPERFTFDRFQVYSAIFITREKFLSYPELADIRRFIVFRDLRDTLISQYFSMRDTHELDPGGIVKERRDILRACSFQEGLEYLLEKALTVQAGIQRSWVNSGETVLRYEDLIQDDLAIFTRLFLSDWKLDLDAKKLEKAVIASRFESVYRRKLGEEDASSHGRKGQPGDWRNHFSRDFARRFHEKYGDLLVAYGYEKDAAWTETLDR